MSELRIGILQQSKTSDMASNIKAIEEEVTDLARRGAELIILSELHNSLYFCQVEDYEKYSLAEEANNSKTLKHFQEMAKKYHIVLPLSFFEKLPVSLSSRMIV